MLKTSFLDAKDRENQALIDYLYDLAHQIKEHRVTIFDASISYQQATVPIDGREEQRDAGIRTLTIQFRDGETALHFWER